MHNNNMVGWCTLWSPWCDAESMCGRRANFIWTVGRWHRIVLLHTRGGAWKEGKWQKGADDIITMSFTFNTICNEMPFANHSPSFLSICFILWEQPVPCPIVLLPFLACSNFKLKSSISGSTISHLDRYMQFYGTCPFVLGNSFFKMEKK